jgi:HEAT repeats
VARSITRAKAFTTYTKAKCQTIEATVETHENMMAGYNNSPLVAAMPCDLHKREFLMLSMLAWGTVLSPAQDLQGRFYPEKDSYMLGEPVLFNVEIKNTGPETVYLNAKDPHKCLDRYEFFITGPASGCGANWIPECEDETMALKAGDSDHGQWELDSWYQFEREGKYTVNATRHIPIESIHGEFQDFTFSSKFEVKLEAPDPLRVQSILQEFERNLNSSDFDVRHTALDVLSTTAPAYFENIALTLSHDKDAFVVFHAAAALGRINTAETRAALADIITSRQANNENEIIARIRAIEGLGRSGDETYQTLVSRYLDDPEEYVQLAAMVAVAQLGKAPAVPQLQRYFFSPNPVFRKNAVHALRFSTTPEAVEILIDALTDKDAGVRERASTSLTELTSHSVGNTNDGMTPTQMQERWRKWFRENKGKPPLPEHIEFLCHMK